MTGALSNFAVSPKYNYKIRLHMGMQHGIKSSVPPMDSSFRAALEETAASNDNTFTSTSNRVLCVNAKRREKKKKRGKEWEKKRGCFSNTPIYVLYSYILFFQVSHIRARSTELSKQHTEIFDEEWSKAAYFHWNSFVDERGTCQTVTCHKRHLDVP